MQNHDLAEAPRAVALEVTDNANSSPVGLPPSVVTAVTGSPPAGALPGRVNDEVLAEAQKLAAQGFPVVATYGLTANETGMRCSCADREKCRSAGKHPVPEGGHKAATCDADELRRTLDHDRPRNIGIRTGLASGLVVLDCDNRNGGHMALKAYESEHGPLPKTATAKTGDGHHYYFLHPGAGEIKCAPLCKGLDIRADGGMVIAPPSRHKSGRIYSWLPGLSIHEVKLAPLPTPLLSMLQKKHEKKVKPKAASGHERAADDGELVEQGERHAFLVRQAGRFRHQRLEHADIEARLFELNDARCVPPLEEEEVRRIAKDIAAKPPGPRTKRNAPALLRAAERDDNWPKELLMNEKGELFSTLANATTILGNDKNWDGVLAFDQFAHAITKTRTPPWHEHDKPRGKPSVSSEQWTDEDTSRTSAWLTREYGLNVSVEVVYRAIKIVSEQHPKHPIRTYLSALEWDGVRRVEIWLTTYLGVANTEYTRLVGRLWLVSAIARVMMPGAKVDHVLILEGPQGQKKSTALRVLAGDKYFIDTSIEIGTKDAFMQLRRAWIVELAELDSLSRAEAAKAKQFFTSAVDVYRPPYGHEVVSVPRQQVFAGTVNDEQYLKDDTGNRRYWPVTVGSVDIDALTRDRDQLWAEAFDLWRRGTPWYPMTDDEHSLCRAEQSKRMITDPWLPLVEAWLFKEGLGTVSTIDVLVNALGVGKGAVTRVHTVRVGHILRQLGGKRRQIRQADGHRAWVYDVPTVVDEVLNGMPDVGG